MPTFDDREKAFEAKFRMDEETKFKVQARRARLLGQWTAGKLGLTGAEADAYAKTMVAADFEEAGDADLIRKVTKDLSGKGVTVSEAEIRKQLSDFLETAKRQLASEQA
jgi:hypothetical protein